MGIADPIASNETEMEEGKTVVEFALLQMLKCNKTLKRGR
jgi:hypothetical protein